MRIVLLGALCALLATGCGWNFLATLALTGKPPVVEGRVYGNSVGESTKVAVKSFAYEAGEETLFDYATLEGGRYEYQLPKAAAEDFVFFAFDDQNGNNLPDADEPRSEQLRCGVVTAEAPGSGATARWRLRTCSNEGGPASYDFAQADIRFGSAEASPGASSDATASSYPAPRPSATPRPMPAGGIGGGILG